MHLSIDLPNEEVVTIHHKMKEMYFDGTSKSPTGERKENPQETMARVGIVLVYKDNSFILSSFYLTKGCSNIIVEYKIVIVGLELPLQIRIDNLRIYGIPS